MSEQREGRRMLLFLVGVFVFPVMVGLVLYQTGWRPGGKSHGELMKPPHMLRFASMQTAQGAVFDMSSLRGKWHLAMVSSSSCASDCQQNLHMMRQIHASLGKEIDRLERVWIQDGEPLPEVARAEQGKYPDLVILPKATMLTQQFDAASPGRGIFLIDPLGNVFMRYPPGTDPAGIRKDLMRLLTYSWTG